VTLRDAWESHAQEWVAWAQAENHDGFWGGTWPELEPLLPSAADQDLVVEIGCGEGRASRRLMERGHWVVAVEQSGTLAKVASEGTPAVPVIRADAVAVPLPSSVASAVVACMSLQDVDDLTATLAEIGRILRPGGCLCVAIVHPFASAQDLERFGGPPRGAQTISERYLETRRYEDRVDRGALGMTFVSMHRPLSAYVAASAAAGLWMSALREFGRKPIPWLLTARFEKVGQPG
jgi:SAM-dependent methyltransferase